MDDTEILGRKIGSHFEHEACDNRYLVLERFLRRKNASRNSSSADQWERSSSYDVRGIKEALADIRSHFSISGN